MIIYPNLADHSRQCACCWHCGSLLDALSVVSTSTTFTWTRSTEESPPRWYVCALRNKSHSVVACPDYFKFSQLIEAGQTSNNTQMILISPQAMAGGHATAAGVKIIKIVSRCGVAWR